MRTDEGTPLITTCYMTYTSFPNYYCTTLTELGSVQLILAWLLLFLSSYLIKDIKIEFVLIILQSLSDELIATNFKTIIAI